VSIGLNSQDVECRGKQLSGFGCRGKQWIWLQRKSILKTLFAGKNNSQELGCKGETINPRILNNSYDLVCRGKHSKTSKKCYAAPRLPEQCTA
jgi:hypothetical protein